MGPPGCKGRNSGGAAGPCDWMTMARSWRGRQWNGLVGPKRAICGVHGGGIDSQHEAGGLGERGEGEEIQPAAKVARSAGGEGLVDGIEVALLMPVAAAGEDARHLQVCLAPLDDFRPARSRPVFLRPSRAGMDEDEGAGGHFRLLEELPGLARGPIGEVELDRGILRQRQIEGAEEVEMMIDGVMLPDGGGDELIVEDLAET